MPFFLYLWKDINENLKLLSWIKYCFQ